MPSGTPKLSGASATVERNGTSVDVLFPSIDATAAGTEIAAGQVVTNYTLATVMSGKMTTGPIGACGASPDAWTAEHDRLHGPVRLQLLYHDPRQRPAAC